ncbi:hypothetical protein FB390_4188 [Nocardia bhagyanarayanae]|uniref:Uncharacterized protein n=1 Tax=Nocardia bhagyanarayanae TaxID=1215925 RepID=A0A543FF61_9NOCA|nr:hypothetical protein FB390_4188 [Nocardia bhagyanarayanae]
MRRAWLELVRAGQGRDTRLGWAQRPQSKPRLRRRLMAGPAIAGALTGAFDLRVALLVVGAAILIAGLAVATELPTAALVWRGGSRSLPGEVGPGRGESL